MRHTEPGIDDDLIHVDFLNAIDSDVVRAAYFYLVRNALGLNEFKCFPYVTGQSKRVFSYNTHADRPFEFIVTRTHLLFYFRKASKGYRARSAALLSEQFGATNVNINGNGEITVRITDLRSAQRLHRLLFHSEQDSP